MGSKATKSAFPEVKYKDFMSLLNKWDKGGWIKRTAKVGKLSAVEVTHNGSLFIKFSFEQYSILFSIVTWEYLVINVLHPYRG